MAKYIVTEKRGPYEDEEVALPDDAAIVYIGDSFLQACSWIEQTGGWQIRAMYKLIDTTEKALD